MNGYAYNYGLASPPPYPEQGEAMSASDSDSDDSVKAQSAQLMRRYGNVSLRPKHILIQKLHSNPRKFFDSGEYFSAREGKIMQDLLPGGAPVDSCPVKMEPTVAPVRGRTGLDRVGCDPQPRRLVTNYSVCDY
mmetsp:Transcript_9692/g.24091  ORF Transcript_9692/g.24091 Transcript_9692/m.24091 type:complete len:134 (-) Transcript_9692:1222-1623(-)